MEVMDWHEQYQDGDEAVQARALTAMRQMETSLDKGVAAYFNQDTLLLDSEALQILREYYYRRKYLDRMRSHS